jgi:hypothetical protein
MKFSSSFTSLLALVFIAAALPAPDGRGIRFPLTRKSANVVGHVDLSALKAQLIHVSK